MALPRQSLRACFSRKRKKLLQVCGTIDIHRKPGELEHDARLTRSLRRRMMGLETIIAKTQRKQISRPAKNGVRAASVAGRNQHRSLCRSVLEDLLQFPRLNERYVGRNHERAVFAALH